MRRPPPLGFEVGMGDPLLYQNARYAALSQSPDADNLTAVRVEVETTGKKQCVTLSGRAYRITAMRSVATPVAATGWATVGGLAEPEATAHSAAVRHGSADEERPNRLFFTLGAPGYGVPLYLGYGRGGAHLGFEVGALAETHGAGGIAASLRYQTSVGSLLRPYSGLRLAGLTGPHGAFARADVFGGAEVAFERLTVRAELGARVDSDLGVRPMFAVGPGLRF